MVDPDATSRATPTLRNVLHWLVVNIKGKDFTGAYTFAGYWGPAPPAGSGLHRYAFYYFRQSGVLDLTGTDAGTRLNFSVKDFAAQYGLGNPVAGNFFQAQIV